jgi:hypothetical protein
VVRSGAFAARQEFPPPSSQTFSLVFLFPYVRLLRLLRAVPPLLPPRLASRHSSLATSFLDSYVKISNVSLFKTCPLDFRLRWAPANRHFLSLFSFAFAESSSGQTTYDFFNRQYDY